MVVEEENLADFKEELLDELDQLRLEPAAKLRPILYVIGLILPGILIVIFWAIYRNTFWYIALVVSVGFLSIGTLYAYSDFKKISEDKNIYIFNRTGIEIIEPEENIRVIPWKDVQEIKAVSRYSSKIRLRRCLITTKSEKFSIYANSFVEVTTKSRHPAPIITEILKYYERMKEEI